MLTPITWVKCIVSCFRKLPHICWLLINMRVGSVLQLSSGDSGVEIQSCRASSKIRMLRDLNNLIHWLLRCRPPSGTMLLYHRSRVKYRKDGYYWKKRRDGKTTREDHAKLKVHGLECIYGCYVHSAILPTFHRRSYWLLQVDFCLHVNFAAMLSMMWYVMFVVFVYRIRT